jgi:cell division protein YceG involved in septum cleavage
MDAQLVEAALVFCLTVLVAVIGWLIRRYLYIDKNYLSRDEHAKICLQQDERVYRLLNKLDRKLDANQLEARESRHHVNNELTKVKVGLARVQERLEVSDD